MKQILKYIFVMAICVFSHGAVFAVTCPTTYTTWWMSYANGYRHRFINENCTQEQINYGCYYCNNTYLGYCNAGYHVTNQYKADVGCAACPDGYYSSSTNTSSYCSECYCTGGKYISVNTKTQCTCTKCPTGQYKPSSSTYWYNTNCFSIYCSAGRYINLTINSSGYALDGTCSVCPDHTYRSGSTTSAVSCYNCPAGYGMTGPLPSDHDSFDDCLQLASCPSGQYGVPNSALGCKPCPSFGSTDTYGNAAIPASPTFPTGANKLESSCYVPTGTYRMESGEFEVRNNCIKQ